MSFSKEDIEKAFNEAEKNAPPMYHPIHERSNGAWFPSNEAASIGSLISHTWEDIQTVFKIRSKLKGGYEMRLLFKYIVIELRSIVEQLERLQGIIFHVIKGEPKHNLPSGYISEEEAKKTKELFNKYHSVKKHLESDLISIRNNIGAHRGTHPWNDIVELWDKLDPDKFKELFVVIPELVNYLVKLDIYDWTRNPGDDGSIEICCSGLDRPMP